MKKINVGIVGCGNVSDIYLSVCADKFEFLQFRAAADINQQKAKELAEKYNIPEVCTVNELLEDEEIDVVLNLTIPAVHAEITLKALGHNKHVYTEKPLALTLEDGLKILEVAKEKNLRVGAAPDTFLGGSLQTCRKLIDDQWIGKPIAFNGFMMGSGPEEWHPNPEIFYQTGAGPMFDMGPYYLTAMVSFFGPVNRISGSAGNGYNERVITSESRYGEKFNVEVPTYISGVMDFKSGVIGTLITSFDIRMGSTLPNIEIYGTEGTMVVPDPNFAKGPIKIKRLGMEEWQEVPLTHGFTEHCRGIGLVEFAKALITGKEHRTSADMAYHVLELMHGFHIASEKGEYYNVSSTCERPKPLPQALDEKMFEQFILKSKYDIYKSF